MHPWLDKAAVVQLDVDRIVSDDLVRFFQRDAGLRPQTSTRITYGVPLWLEKPPDDTRNSKASLSMELDNVNERWFHLTRAERTFKTTLRPGHHFLLHFPPPRLLIHSILALRLILLLH